MKRLYFAILGIAMLVMAGCGGVQTVSGGRADEAAIHFVAEKVFDISVQIDDATYAVKTVKERTYRKDKSLKKTAQNTIVVKPGQHKVVVLDLNGNQLYEHVVFVSANEHKVVRL